MKIYLKNKNHTLIKDFPMNVFEIRDTLDRLGNQKGDTKVRFELFEFDNQKLSAKNFLRKNLEIGGMSL